jgi:hypothetical protein
MGNLTRRIVLAATVLGLMAGKARADLILTYTFAGETTGNISLKGSFEIDSKFIEATGNSNINKDITNLLFTDGTNTFSPGGFIPSNLKVSSDGDLVMGTFSGTNTDGSVTLVVAASGMLDLDFGAIDHRSSVGSYSGSGNWTHTPLDPISAPEPSTLAMLASAVPLGIGWWLRRRKRAT